MTIITIPNAPVTVRATEKQMTAVYEAAKLGLKGDTLALAAGMTPQKYRALCQLDPEFELQALKGKADSEMLHAGKLAEASLDGDAKARLAILQHVHEWTAKQSIDITSTSISITAALDEARARLPIAQRIFDNQGELTDGTA